MLVTMPVADRDDEARGGTAKTTTVELEGDIDVATASDVGDWLCALITDGYEQVVVVCSKLTFVESRGLAMMARVQRQAEDADCTLTWRELPLHVLRTIHLSGLDSYLRIEA
jgi:anti-anti-sigma factor